MSPAAGHHEEPKREGTDRRNGDKEGRASLLPADTDSQIPFSCKDTTNRILPPRAAVASQRLAHGSSKLSPRGGVAAPHPYFQKGIRESAKSKRRESVRAAPKRLRRARACSSREQVLRGAEGDSKVEHAFGLRVRKACEAGRR